MSLISGMICSKSGFEEGLQLLAIQPRVRSLTRGEVGMLINGESSVYVHNPFHPYGVFKAVHRVNHLQKFSPWTGGEVGHVESPAHFSLPGSHQGLSNEVGGGEGHVAVSHQT